MIDQRLGPGESPVQKGGLESSKNHEGQGLGGIPSGPPRPAVHTPGSQGVLRGPPHVSVRSTSAPAPRPVLPEPPSRDSDPAGLGRGKETWVVPKPHALSSGSDAKPHVGAPPTPPPSVHSSSCKCGSASLCAGTRPGPGDPAEDRPDQRPGARPQEVEGRRPGRARRCEVPGCREGAGGGSGRRQWRSGEGYSTRGARSAQTGADTNPAQSAGWPAPQAPGASCQTACLGREPGLPEATHVAQDGGSGSPSVHRGGRAGGSRP